MGKMRAAIQKRTTEVRQGGERENPHTWGIHAWIAAVRQKNISSFVYVCIYSASWWPRHTRQKKHKSWAFPLISMGTGDLSGWVTSKVTERIKFRSQGIIYDSRCILSEERRKQGDTYALWRRSSGRIGWPHGASGTWSAGNRWRLARGRPLWWRKGWWPTREACAGGCRSDLGREWSGTVGPDRQSASLDKEDKWNYVFMVDALSAIFLLLLLPFALLCTLSSPGQYKWHHESDETVL